VTPEALGRAAGAHVVAFEVYGTGVTVSVPDATLVPYVVERIPLHAARRDPRPGDRRVALEVAGGGLYAVAQEGEVVLAPAPLNGALAVLRRQLFFLAIDHARDHLVVSAGVVGHEGRAIVLPGATMAGKTMLVAALLRAGAVYYTDDWAVLDPEGRAVPYPGLLALRRAQGGRVSAQSLGAEIGDEPIPVGLIAKVAFNPDGRWEPRPRTSGDGVMMLLGHAYGVDDAAVAMKIARYAVEGASVLEGERGEADEAAAALLELAAQPPTRDKA
jgi:hypothetical protein